MVVFPFDQHASPPDGIAVDFLGHPAGTFKSLAIMALATGAPVVPASSWREPDGSHVLRFEEALPLVECDKVNGGNPAQHPCVQCDARNTGAAPPRAVVLGAPPLEARAGARWPKGEAAQAPYRQPH